MKAISLWQPWASALFTPLKINETRSWRFPASLEGDRVLIHAAKKDNAELRAWWSARCGFPEWRGEFLSLGVNSYDQLPRGCLLGSGVLAGCVRTEDSGVKPGSAEYEWGDYSPGRFAWKLRHMVRFDRPIPCVGRQGFFNVDLSL